MTPQSIGQYRVVRQLGEGGMGVVYEVKHDLLEKRAALKLLHAEYSQNPQIRARFFNEARAANLVQHPGLVNIFEFGKMPDGSMYMVMEYLEGESLRARLKKSGTALSPAQTIKLVRQIASALAVAHSKRVVHRDLKPDNVMIINDPDVSGGERTKLLDFGIAKIIEDLKPADGSFRTRTGMIMGTPAYMAPEQCRGVGSIDEKADVYSLGVMLYEMLCGRVPFIGEGAGDVMAMHIVATPQPLQELAPHVPAELVALVHSMLIKAPAQRPAMADVVQALNRDPASDSGHIPLPSVYPAAAHPTLPFRPNDTTLLGGERTARRPKTGVFALAVGFIVAIALFGALRIGTRNHSTAAVQPDSIGPVTGAPAQAVKPGPPPPPGNPVAAAPASVKTAASAVPTKKISAPNSAQPGTSDSGSATRKSKAASGTQATNSGAAQPAKRTKPESTNSGRSKIRSNEEIELFN